MHGPYNNAWRKKGRSEYGERERGHVSQCKSELISSSPGTTRALYANNLSHGKAGKYRSSMSSSRQETHQIPSLSGAFETHRQSEGGEMKSFSSQAYLLRLANPKFSCQVLSSLYDIYSPQKKQASPRQSTLFSPSLSSYPGNAGVTRIL